MRTCIAFQRPVFGGFRWVGSPPILGATDARCCGGVKGVEVEAEWTIGFNPGG